MTATYRLQLHERFGFAEVRALLPYFRQLGISHLYLSPITEARSGSTHGYDVIDHNAVRDDIGGRRGLDHLLDAALDADLRVVFDWVPNHAGVGTQNEYWQDVLAFGPHSKFARHFDIDWHPLKPELQRRVLLPFLGRPYGDVLDDGEIGLAYDDGRFFASYFDSRFALSPATYHTVIAGALARYERSNEYWDLKDLLEAYEGLAPDEREKAGVLESRLVAMAERTDPSSWLQLDVEALHDLLEQQWWRLAFWKTAGYEINYRRFFDINELVGLRMENEYVFWDAHRLLGEVLTHEAAAGVRIDHIDGMFDPDGYLGRLRELGATQIWVEKILAHGEILPEEWPVAGTTGYEFMNDVMRVLTRPEGEVALDRAYHRYVEGSPTYRQTVYRSKLLIMKTMLASELFRLAYELDRISEADYHTRDFTLDGLRAALSEVVAAFDRYRTYLPHDEHGAREVVHAAIQIARRRTPATEPTVYEFIERVILGEVREDLQEAQRAWVGRFQQYTAPVAAKGVEDTAFYRYLRLSALNEVGGEPDQFAVPPQPFHAHARFRARRYPHNIVTTATHDHKRGEDTRMRLIALAERAEAWEQMVLLLEQIAADHRGHHGPDRGMEYLLFQTLAALWHDGRGEELTDRLAQYLLKAARESKQHTSWVNEDSAYEKDLDAFVRGVCGDERLDDVIGPLSADLARLGFHNSISQLVLKLTTPGVPDLYQGTELLDLSLVDPDNRRPVDFENRQALLDELRPLIERPEPAAIGALVDERNPAAKLYVTARLLRLRRERPMIFDGEYHALEVQGEGADRWIACARTSDQAAVVVVVARFPGTEDPCAARISLPADLSGRMWQDWLSGGEIPDGEVLVPRELPLPWAVLTTPSADEARQ